MNTATIVGVWCLVTSAVNGGGLPRTNEYERKADCPAENRIVIKRHSLKGLAWQLADGQLIVEGYPK